MNQDYPVPLLERVSCAIDRSICPDQWLHMDAARAAILEVAAWLKEYGYMAQTESAVVLERQINQPTNGCN